MDEVFPYYVALVISSTFLHKYQHLLHQVCSLKFFFIFLFKSNSLSECISIPSTIVPIPCTYQNMIPIASHIIYLDIGFQFVMMSITCCEDKFN